MPCYLGSCYNNKGSHDFASASTNKPCRAARAPPRVAAHRIEANKKYVNTQTDWDCRESA